MTTALEQMLASIKPAAVSDAVWGPWITASTNGSCAGCGREYDIFAQVRTDGAGGWLAECCGHNQVSATPAPVVAPNPLGAMLAAVKAAPPAAPTAPRQPRTLTDLILMAQPAQDPPPQQAPEPPQSTLNTVLSIVGSAVANAPAGAANPNQPLGHVFQQAQAQRARPAESGTEAARPGEPLGAPPASTVHLIRGVLMDFEASRPRTMQKALGPSELGTPCQAQIARKLMGSPRVPVTEPTWAPWQGTCIHAGMEDVLAFHNAQLGYQRWLPEDRLTVDDGDPTYGIDPIAGSGDAFDLDTCTVVDWKYVGKTALEKLDRGLRMGKPPWEQVSPEYRVQAHLYGYGHARKGRTVKWVRLVLLARDYQYDKSREWTEAYNPDIAMMAIHRYYQTHDLVAELGVAKNPEAITQVPTAASRDACKWCPFYRPGQSTSWAGCQGDRSPEKSGEIAMRGLIEAA